MVVTRRPTRNRRHDGAGRAPRPCPRVDRRNRASLGRCRPAGTCGHPARWAACWPSTRLIPVHAAPVRAATDGTQLASDWGTIPSEQQAGRAPRPQPRRAAPPWWTMMPGRSRRQCSSSTTTPTYATWSTSGSPTAAIVWSRRLTAGRPWRRSRPSDRTWSSWTWWCRWWTAPRWPSACARTRGPAGSRSWWFRPIRGRAIASAARRSRPGSPSRSTLTSAQRRAEPVA